MEDIRSKVFEYVKVLARPMVLYQHEHPIHWSPVYVGGKVCKSKIITFLFDRAFPIYYLKVTFLSVLEQQIWQREYRTVNDVGHSAYFRSTKLYGNQRIRNTIICILRIFLHFHIRSIIKYTYVQSIHLTIINIIVIAISQVKTANLLGIVGTDVPVEEIQKLVPPYKVSKILLNILSFTN